MKRSQRGELLLKDFIALSGSKLPRFTAYKKRGLWRAEILRPDGVTVTVFSDTYSGLLEEVLEYGEEN